MSFGFSIGDFIAVTGIAFNLCESIRSFPADHSELVLKLEFFRCSLQEAKDVISRCQLAPATAMVAERQFENCHQLLQELEKSIMKYNTIPGGKGASMKKLRWGIYKKDESMKLVEKLECQINSFNLFLIAYNMRMLQEKDVIRQRIEATPQHLDSWSDFQPIRFIDALDRKITFPFETCRTWESFQDLLKLSFRGSAGKGWVDAGRYMIADESTGNALTAKEWDGGIKPGMMLSMAMVVHKQKATDITEHNCPSCQDPYRGFIGKELQRVKCNRCATWFQVSLVPRITDVTDNESAPEVLNKQTKKQLVEPKEIDTPLDTDDLKYFRRLQVLTRKLNLRDDDVQKALARYCVVSEFKPVHASDGAILGSHGRIIGHYYYRHYGGYRAGRFDEERIEEIMNDPRYNSTHSLA